MREISVAVLPDRQEPEQMIGGMAVVIDVLRASTTIIHALAAGALRVMPCLEVEEAKEVAAQLPGEVLLGGERGGELIDGFDLDNSPLKYTPEMVSGKSVVFTTTNGTRALAHSIHADHVVIGSFVNIQAVLDFITGSDQPVFLICAGTRGNATDEDNLFAGAVVAGLRDTGEKFTPTGDAAEVEQFFRSVSNSRDTFFQAMCQSTGGKHLLELGYQHDIERAAEWNRFSVLPGWSAETNSIQTVFETATADHWMPLS